MNVCFISSLQFFISAEMGDQRMDSHFLLLTVSGIFLVCTQELMTCCILYISMSSAVWLIQCLWSNKTLDICSRMFKEHLSDPDMIRGALEARMEAISVIRHLRDKKSISISWKHFWSHCQREFTFSLDIQIGEENLPSFLKRHLKYQRRREACQYCGPFHSPSVSQIRTSALPSPYSDSDPTPSLSLTTTNNPQSQQWTPNCLNLNPF